MAKLESFETNVFINCPFDDAYLPILWAMVFTVLACGFTPRSALEERDSGQVRLDKIKRLIGGSRLGIHDISRTELDSANSLPRFNMPFELGLDLGARHWGRGDMKKKQLIIFDSEKFRYQNFLSDIAGQDISAHGNSTSELIEKLREWLNASRGQLPRLPSSDALIALYEKFSNALPVICESLKFNPKKLSYNDFQAIAGEWLLLHA